VYTNFFEPPCTSVNLKTLENFYQIMKNDPFSLQTISTVQTIARIIMRGIWTLANEGK